MTSASELFLLDTNVVVQYIRANPLSQRIESKFQLRHRKERPLISIVSVGELEALVRKFNWGEKKIRALEAHLRELVVVDITSRPVLVAYGEISSWAEKEGKRMGQQNDIWIAATARATRAHLITTDKDFDDLHPRFLRRTYVPPR